MPSDQDPRVQDGAYVTDETALFRVLRHEEYGRRVWVENCSGVKHPDMPLYYFRKRWFSDLEIRRDFRLVKAAPPSIAEPEMVAA